MSIPYHNPGIPMIGIGTFMFLKYNRKIDEENLKAVVDTALEAGYRLMDIAPKYAKVIGACLPELLAKYNLVRSDIFITSKIRARYVGYADTITSCLQTIQDLQCECLDMLVVVWPGKGSMKPNDTRHAELRKETFKALEYLKEIGLIRFLGVSNWGISHLKEMMEFSNQKPDVAQLEFHIHSHEADLLKYCRDNDIFVQSYTSLAAGVLLEDPTVIEIAKKLSRTPAQILLKWSIQQGVGVYPKSTSREHIISNFQVHDFTIGDEDMATLSSLNLDKFYYWNSAQIA